MSNNITEQQIREKLKQIAALEPPQSSVQWMSQNVRSMIENKKEKAPETPGILYYTLSAAAMLLVGIGFLYYSSVLITPDKHTVYTQSESIPTLAELHAIFESGGQKALEEHLEEKESNRQPRAETMTLDEIMKELRSEGN